MAWSGRHAEDARSRSLVESRIERQTYFDRENSGMAIWRMGELTAVIDIQNQYVAVFVSLGICHFPTLTIPPLYD